MTLEKKLKALSKITPGTLRVYMQNIRRLYRLGGGEGDLPESKVWLMKTELWKKMLALPLGTRRHLSLAGLKAAYALKVGEKNTKKWYGQMIRDDSRFRDQRSLNKASDKEKKLLPKGGVGALKKAAVDLKKRLRFVLAAEPTLKGLYAYEWFLATKLFTELPFRNDMPSIKVGKHDKGNVLVTPPKGNYKFLMRNYKNSDRLGERTISLSRAGTMAVRKFLKYRDKVPAVKHDFLFTSYTGTPMTKASFGKALQKRYEQLLGARLGSRLIRVIHANENKDAIRAAKELSNKMLHSQNQTSQYIKQ